MLVEIDFYARIQVDFSAQSNFSCHTQDTLAHILHGRDVLHHFLRFESPAELAFLYVIDCSTGLPFIKGRLAVTKWCKVAKEDKRKIWIKSKAYLSGHNWRFEERITFLTQPVRSGFDLHSSHDRKRHNMFRQNQSAKTVFIMRARMLYL